LFFLTCMYGSFDMHIWLFWHAYMSHTNVHDIPHMTFYVHTWLFENAYMALLTCIYVTYQCTRHSTNDIPHAQLVFLTCIYGSFDMNIWLFWHAYMARWFTFMYGMSCTFVCVHGYMIHESKSTSNICMSKEPYYACQKSHIMHVKRAILLISLHSRMESRVYSYVLSPRAIYDTYEYTSHIEMCVWLCWHTCIALLTCIHSSFDMYVWLICSDTYGCTSHVTTVNAKSIKDLIKRNQTSYRIVPQHYLK